jgi:ABC-type Zn uptake system ZnuABC Zn-binding protein ZnuA
MLGLLLQVSLSNLDDFKLKYDLTKLKITASFNILHDLIESVSNDSNE